MSISNIGNFLKQKEKIAIKGIQRNSSGIRNQISWKHRNKVKTYSCKKCWGEKQQGMRWGKEDTWPVIFSTTHGRQVINRKSELESGKKKSTSTVLTKPQVTHNLRVWSSSLLIVRYSKTPINMMSTLSSQIEAATFWQRRIVLFRLNAPCHICYAGIIK